MDRFLFIAFCSIIFWAPIPIGSNRDGLVSVLGVAIGAIFCLWLLTNRNPLPQAFNRNKGIIWLFWLIPLWSAIQLIPLPAAVLQSISPNTVLYDPGQHWRTISLDPAATWYKLQRSITYALFFVMALVLVNTPQRIERMFQMLIISGVLQACYGVLVVTGGSSFDILHIQDIHHGNLGSAKGTFTNRNHYAGYLEMCLAIGIGLMVSQILARKSKFAGWRAISREILVSLFSGKARLRIFLALMVVALVLSHSRMGNTAFFASLGLSSVIGLWIYRKSKNATSLLLLFGSLILVDILIVGAWFGLDELAARLEHSSSDADGRLIVFQLSLQTVKDFWLSGSGAGSFYNVFPHYRNNQIFGFFDQAHNDFLQILIEYGVVGSCLFALIVIRCFARAIQAQTTRYTALLRGAGFAAMMGITSLMIHSAADFNLQIPSNAVLFTLLCAFACIASTIEQQEHARHGKNR